MRHPVIIAACNEAEYLGRTLDSLDPSTVDPFVVINGSTDDSAEIANQHKVVTDYGATVMELPEAGKLPAIQEAIKCLGNRAIEEVVLLLDADSRPLMPKKWARAMTRTIDKNYPAVVAGTVLFEDAGFAANVLWSTNSLLKSTVAAARQAPRISGANMALYLHDRKIRRAVLDLPHVWRGDDRFIQSTMAVEGANKYYRTSPGAMVWTSGRYLSPIPKLIVLNKEGRDRVAAHCYDSRSAPAATHAYNNDGSLTVMAEVSG